VPYRGLEAELNTKTLTPEAGKFPEVNGEYVRVSGRVPVGDSAIDTDVYYSANGKAYFQRQAVQEVGEDDLGDLSSNQLGDIVEQQVAVDVAERKGYDVLYTDDGSNGIDMIARDDDGNIVIIESKYSGSDDRFTASDFDSERQGAKQMTDDSVELAFTGERTAVRKQLGDDYAEVTKAIRSRDYRKELVLAKPDTSRKLLANSPELLNRIDRANIVKFGQSPELSTQ
jgi:hypothetical protein